MSLTSNYDPRLCTVYTDDNGQHMLMLPGGQHFAHVIETVVTTKRTEAGTCTATFCVNVVATKEAADKIYSKEPQP